MKVSYYILYSYSGHGLKSSRETIAISMNVKSFLENLIQIPAGAIKMRDDRTNTVWTERIETFQLGRYPVTRLLYAEIMERQTPAKSEQYHPVQNVSWLEAASFCNRMSSLFDMPKYYTFDPDGGDAVSSGERVGFRLPSEAEWEFACRAGTLGPRFGNLEDIAWYERNSGGGTRPVGLLKPNNWGLHDMLGNVWEWCDDVYDPSVYGQYRVFRGGGWADQPRGCLATNRRRSHPTFAIDDLGFRIAVSA